MDSISICRPYIQAEHDYYHNINDIIFPVHIYHQPTHYFLQNFQVTTTQLYACTHRLRQDMK